MEQPYLAQRHLDPRLLRVYTAYRLVLSALFLAMAQFGIAPEYLGSSNPSLFYNTVLIYTLVNIATLPFCYIKQWQPGEPSLFAMFLIDISAIHLMMYASGGLSGSFGYLLLVAVAASSIFQRGRLSLALAAMASMILVSLTIADYSIGRADSSEIVKSGVFGTLLFATALIFFFLSRRLETAQKIAQTESLAAAHLQQLNNLVISKMRTGIIVFDRNFKVEQLNERASLLLGHYSQDKLLSIGDSLKNFPKLVRYYHHWVSNPRRRLPSYQETPANIPLQVSFSNIDGRGQRSTILFLEDARTLSQHAQQLKNLSLGQLTANIAHEVRNPLGAISHAAQLLNETDIAEQDRDLVNIILKHSDRVDTLVRDILQLSRQKTPDIDVINVYQACISAKSQIIESRQFEDPVIELDDSAKNTQAPFDTSQLQQVLVNLISNALRHSQKQNGQAWARLEFSTQEDIQLPALRIYDKGCGVAEENIEKIFEPFFTTDKQGTGLGLYISRGLCEINFATLSYVFKKEGNGYFQIVFSDPEKQLPERTDNE